MENLRYTVRNEVDSPRKSSLHSWKTIKRGELNRFLSDVPGYMKLVRTNACRNSLEPNSFHENEMTFVTVIRNGFHILWMVQEFSGFSEIHSVSGEL